LAISLGVGETEPTANLSARLLDFGDYQNVAFGCDFGARIILPGRLGKPMVSYACGPEKLRSADFQRNVTLLRSDRHYHGLFLNVADFKGIHAG
jgi:hypothetical protein